MVEGGKGMREGEGGLDGEVMMIEGGSWRRMEGGG